MNSTPHKVLPTLNDRPLSEAATWVFDLDNTLYPASCRLFDQVDKNITKFIMQFLGLNWDEAYIIQKNYFREFGTSMNGLMKLHSMDPEQFLKFVHKIDLSPLTKNPRMNLALAKLPGRKIIFTNGSVVHAEGVLGALGITHHFEAIFDIVASSYQPKPNPAVYETFIKKYNIDPQNTVMVEDMACNLVPAHELGMVCILVTSDSDWAQAGSEGSHVHYLVEDLTAWLEIVADRGKLERG